MEQWSASIDFEEITRKCATPLYLFSEAQLKRNFLKYCEIAKQACNIAYPVKANPSFAILRQIRRLGGSVDCASFQEIKLARFAGFAPNQILFNTPAANTTTLTFLLQKGFTVVIDSAEILKELARTIKKSPFSGKLFVRVNPQIPLEYSNKKDWQSLTSHGSHVSKFGIPAEDLVKILAPLPPPITGLHIHVGTQMDNTAVFVNALKFMHELRDELQTQTPHQIDTIDLGGGLGIPFIKKDRYPTIDSLKKSLLPEMKKGIRYIFEPGHSLVGNTMGILTKIVALKKMRKKQWAIVDVGTDQLCKITLLKWPHQILTAAHESLPSQGSDAIGGPLCFAGDVLLSHTSAKKLSVGDPLFIQHCGAYCYALSSHFNGRLYMGMLKVKENGKIVQCNTAESECLEPTYATYQWAADCQRFKQAKPISKKLFNAINSDYLQHGALRDRYDILAVRQIAPDCFEFQFQATTPLQLLSMPFAIRLAGDATIMSILYKLGKRKKDISIWSDNLVLRSNKKVKTDHPISCKIYLSAITTRKEEKEKVVLSQFVLDGGNFSGQLRIKFTDV